MSTIEWLILINLSLVVGSIIYLVWAVRRRRLQAEFHIRLITILTSTVALRELLERVAIEVKAATHATQAFCISQIIVLYRAARLGILGQRQAIATF